ncbi:MAG: rubrerythrin family protein [Clostridiales bacterium]|nr:rubrerythrin family protein [Clostridiales bacterium]
MELKNSETIINLARSFAGEAQAGLRYQFLATLLENQGYFTASEKVKVIAKNETKHAKVFFDHIVKAGGSENIEFTAGFPYSGNTIEDMFNLAIKNEEEEAFSIYPEFASIAEREGFIDIAASFKKIAKVEEAHLYSFKYLLRCFNEDGLYKANEPTTFVCSECGYTETLEEAWDVCPLCGATQGYCDLLLPR